jgi:hypothetical protein
MGKGNFKRCHFISDLNFVGFHSGTFLTHPNDLHLLNHAASDDSKRQAEAYLKEATARTRSRPAMQVAAPDHRIPLPPRRRRQGDEQSDKDERASDVSTNQAIQGVQVSSKDSKRKTSHQSGKHLWPFLSLFQLELMRKLRKLPSSDLEASEVMVVAGKR